MSENKNFFRASAENFKKIPGSPVAYWLKGQDLFLRTKVGDLYISGGRNKTHGNELYLRNWWEPSFKSTRWMVYANGGEFRKYFGNEIDVVDWSDEARSSYESHGGLVNKKFWGHQGICWSLITSASTSFRIKSAYAQYSSGSPTLFDEHLDFSFETLAYLNSPIVRYPESVKVAPTLARWGSHHGLIWSCRPGGGFARAGFRLPEWIFTAA